MNRPLKLLILGFLPLVLGSCAPRRDPPRVVFLIVVDTLRPDRLSCYGYARQVTPNIDRIASRGVLFEQAGANASWTIPSMGAMMTSRYPTQLGLIEKPVDKETFLPHERREQIRYTLPQSAVTLAELLAGKRFRTTAFVNQPFINANEGFIQGFAAWCYPDFDGAVWHDLSEPMPESTRLPIGMEGGQADGLIVDEFVRWMAEAPIVDSFTWIHLLRPHAPYIPPATCMDAAKGTDPSALYDGEVRCTDDDIGRILDAIDRRIGLDNAILVFTSDHGEAFGEHGGHEHGHSLHREVTQIPLIIAAPGLRVGRTACPVRAVDIMPAILSLVRVNAPPEIEGEDALQVLSGDCTERDNYAEGMLYGGTERALRSGNLRLMYDSERREPFTMFDVVNDPGETIDIREGRQEDDRAMRRELDALHKRLAEDLYRSATSDTVMTNARDSERVLNSLRALGYIN